MLTAALFFFISQAKPREELSATRPHPSIFNLYFFISLLGQFRYALPCMLQQIIIASFLWRPSVHVSSQEACLYALDPVHRA